MKYKGLTLGLLSVALGCFVGSAYAASQTSRGLDALQPTKFRAKEHACPDVNKIQKVLFNLKAGQSDKYSHKSLTWEVDVPKSAPEMLVLHGFANADWRMKNNRMVCYYHIENSHALVNATLLKAKVMRPDTIPWEATSHTAMICKGRPDLCVFELTKS